MNNIDKLVRKLCLNGVEFKALEEVFDIRNGYTPSKKNVEYWHEGTIPWFRMEDIRKNGHILCNASQHITISGVKKSGLFKKNSIIMATTATIGEYALVQCDYLANQQFTNIAIKDEYSDLVLPKFLYYYCSVIANELDTICNYSGGIPIVDQKKFKLLKFPIIPIIVQNEIVRILDVFSNLIVELTAELTLRKKQYEYYRDELLKFGEDIKMVSLEDIAIDIYRGSGIKRNQVTSDGTPCVRYGEIYTTYNTYFDKCISHTKLSYIQNPKYFEYGDILFAITGESVEDIAKSVAYIGKDKCLAGGDIVVMKHNQNPKYLAYVLSTYDARKQKSNGKIKSKVVHSSVPDIKKIRIPLPSIELQNRYVEVLDNFESICSNLNIGLPAEIEARQKQYEYYRDKLLSFKELEL